jgi:hypothetical protein
MPKQKKMGKKKEDENFDDMLADFRATDLTATKSPASTATSSLAASSSSTNSAAEARSPRETPPKKVSVHNLSEETITSACRAGSLAQLRLWNRQGVRITRAGHLINAVRVKAPLKVLCCLVKEIGADVNQRGKNGVTALTMAAFLGLDVTTRYLVEEL